jgi:hypothetical protein
MGDIEERFMTVPVAVQARPAERTRFIADRASGRSGTGSVSDFLELERFMASLAGIDLSPDHEDAYNRYQQWWSMTATRRGFVDAATADFGMHSNGNFAAGQE